jgi:hypothetical protein
MVNTIRTPKIDTAADRHGAPLEPAIEIRRFDDIGSCDGRVTSQLARPGEHIVCDPGRVGGNPDKEKSAAGSLVIDYCVVDEIELVGRVLLVPDH